MADHSIKGKTVLIAGGAKNLGGLLARDLAQQGARAVAIHYNSAEKGCRKNCRGNRSIGAKASKAGLTDIADTVPWIRFLVRRLMDDGADDPRQRRLYDEVERAAFGSFDVTPSFVFLSPFSAAAAFGESAGCAVWTASISVGVWRSAGRSKGTS